MVYRQRKWTEDDLLAISNEDDRFERKAGKMFVDGTWQEKLAREICAFANSYGGIIALGVRDEKDKVKTGTDFDGVNPFHNKQRFEDWLEGRISRLLTPPLQNFRILPVQPRSHNSLIPEGKSLYIIEIGESEVAPHQTNDDSRHYYYREGTSVQPAPHLYLEGLRSSKRLVSQTLVRAWLDTFLLDLIDLTRNSTDSFFRKRFVFKVSEKSYDYQIEQPETEFQYPALMDHPNAKQFFSYYPRIEKQFNDYLSLKNELQSLIRQLIYYIEQSQELDKILHKTLTKENLVEAISRGNLDFDNQTFNSSQFDLLCHIFQVPSHKDRYLLNKVSTFLTFELFCRDYNEYWKNKVPTGDNSVLEFFWDEHVEDLKRTVKDPKVSEKLKECEDKREATYMTVWQLNSVLSETAELLTKRSGVPYRES